MGPTGAGHLGARLAALVDGQLGHDERDLVLAHLARCAPCRAEAAEHRALKARLDHLTVPPPGDLQARLLALAPPAPAQPGTLGTAAAAVGGPASGLRTPWPGRHTPPLAATTAVLLVTAGFGLASMRDTGELPARPPVSPAFVVEHATSTTHVPLSDAAVVGATWRSAATGGGVLGPALWRTPWSGPTSSPVTPVESTPGVEMAPVTVPARGNAASGR